MTLTPLAISEVKKILERQSAKDTSLGLRLGVKGGGCSGLSYAMGFDHQREADNISEFDGLKVFIDPKSYLYLSNTTLDFQDSLEGRGFKFVNPIAQKTCGCGESFSV